MDPEEIINLFDSCWFEKEILKKQRSPSKSTGSESNRPDLRVEVNSPTGSESNRPGLRVKVNSPKPEFTRTSTLHTRSMSDQLSLISTSFLGSGSGSGSFSPNSVLHSPPKLNKIISGKEMTEEELQDNTSNIQEAPDKVTRLSRRKKGTSKSLSDLEFEELKGFMDLGFVFSEEDNKDSRLVEIIPGLQRLGKKEADDDDHKAGVSRPYLSEAWEVLESRRRKENPLMNWRVPVLSNEIDMKDSLRLWAHTVASAVK